MDSGNSPLVEIDGYELLEELGRGGTSIVYRARAPDSSLVAFKLFTKRALREETFLNRLEREVAISRTFSHPLLNRLVGHGVTADKAPYIVVELLEGKILRDIMRPGPLRLPNVISLIDNICQAMAGRLPAGSSGYRRVGPGDECLRSVWGLPPPPMLLGYPLFAIWMSLNIKRTRKTDLVIYTLALTICMACGFNPFSR